MHIENWIRRRVHYGWIVAVTFVTILAADWHSVQPSLS